MRITPRALKFGGPALGIVGLLGWYAGRFLGLGGWRLWALRCALWALGALAVFLIYKLLPQKKKSKGPAPEEAEIADYLGTAIRRLTTAGVTGKDGLRTLPVVLFLGPGKSAKTSVIQQAGVETDFLAGDGDGGEPPPPTPTMNLWLSRSTLFLEAGEGASTAPQGWNRILQALRTGAWAGLFREQPSRVAVVCVSSERLTGQDRAGLKALAKELKSRLDEAAAALDTRLPVYVLFTKADLLPHFTEFVRNLNQAESVQPLGVTLPLAEGQDPGLYNQWQSKRLAEALESVFLSLARRRADVMAREGDAQDRTAAYEFPREFRKVTDLAQDFLLELTRPSQLRVSPFLRGFYFTGIRPVSPTARPEPAVAPPIQQGHKGATMVFDPSQLPGAPPPPPTAGRVAQWTFLGRLVPEVILRDTVAVEASKGGPRRAFRKRALLASGAGLVTILALFFCISFIGNKGLQRETRQAVQAVESLRASGPGLPAVEDLQRLETLRAQVAKLAGYERDHRPLWIRWGLYSGSSMLPHVRRLYFQQFRSLLFESARVALAATLGDLPEEPTQDEYEAKYRALKAYLITTAYPDSSSASFLGPLLLEEWVRGRAVDEETSTLARAQFDLYAAELPHGNPYGDTEENLTVGRARAFLKNNASEESFYAAMLSQANSQVPSIQFNRDRPGTSGYLVSTMEVPGAFTQAGWQYVQQGLGSATDFFQRETYVVGEDYFSDLDPDRMAESLGARYQEQYVQTWMEFLSSASVPNPGLNGSERILSELAGPRSPLFQLFDIATEHTVVDSAAVGVAFQPLHVLSPPEVTDRPFGEASLPYLTELSNLARAMGQLAGDPGSSSAQDAAAGVAQAAAGQIDALRLTFNAEPAAALGVGTSVEALLRAPVGYARSAIGRSGVAAMAGRRDQFCRGEGSVLQAFPFQVAGRDAGLDAFNALLHPDAGLLQAIMDEVTGAGLNPAPELRSFVDRARRVSGVLYGHGGESPRLRFRLRGQPSDEVPTIVLNVDGDEEGYSRNDTRWGNFTWEGATAGEVVLRAQVGERSDSLSYRGTWALFKFFHQATWQASGSTWRLSWTLDDTGATVQADLDLLGEDPILRRGFFDGFACPRRFAR